MLRFKTGTLQGLIKEVLIFQNGRAKGDENIVPFSLQIKLRIWGTGFMLAYLYNS